MGWKRIAIETGIVFAVLLVAAGVWGWKNRQITQSERRADERVGETVREAESWATDLAAGQAESVARAFAAGIAPQVLADRAEAVELAVLGLLEVRDVIFVHVLDTDGGVIASSDRKLTTTGEAGEDAAWALASTELITRPSSRPGVLELAAPIVGPAGPRGFLWMGFDTAREIEATRPAALTAAPEVAPGTPSGALR